MAIPSVAINGLDAPSTLIVPDAPSDPTQIEPDDPNYEPYNPKLAQRLRELYATVEAETAKSTELRREAPTTAAEEYIKRLKADLDEHDEAWAKSKADAMKNVEGGLEGWQLARSTEVQDTWKMATTQLDQLRSIPKDVERLERAQKAAIEVEGT